MLLSSLQDGSEAVTLALQAPPATTALIDGPKDVLWFGFGAFIFIFVVALYMIIHARVIAPSRRKVSERAVFEPAGSDADIIFDEPEFDSHEPETHPVKEKEQLDSHEDVDEVTADPAYLGREHALFSGQPQTNLGTLVSDLPSEEKKHRSPIAGLFSRKSKDKQAPQLTEHAPSLLDDKHWAENDQADHSADSASSFNALNEPFEYSVRPSVQTDQLQKLDDDVEARRRKAELDDADHITYEQNEFYTRQRAEELREAEFERQKSNAALEQRMQSLATMERTLSETANTLRDDTHAAQERLDTSIEERFAALSEELNARLDQTTAANAQSKYDQAIATSERTLTEMADYVGRELGNLNTSMQDALRHLSRRIDEINADPVDAAGIAHQLAELKLAIGNRISGDKEHRASLIDIVRKNLPVDRYSFGDPLPNGDSTDCRVKLISNEAPLVIDAHYPVSAYDHYRRAKSVSGENQQAANEYRNALLLHINTVAKKMIVSGETANSAMLFAPSDVIINDLHANFPDLIEDSHRARVWIVSPTSLSATLHVLSTLAPSAPPHTLEPKPMDREDNEVIAEIEGLRRRLGDHGQGANIPPDATSTVTEAPKPDTPNTDAEDHNGDDVGDLNSGPLSISPEEEAFERLEREEKLAESSKDETSEKSTDRPPFPLR